jgi:hypothetical protein
MFLSLLLMFFTMTLSQCKRCFELKLDTFIKTQATAALALLGLAPQAEQ